jgi:hypothetical protein
MGALNAEVQRSRLLFESAPENLNVKASQTGGMEIREMPLKESSPLESHSENLRTAQEKLERPEKKDRDSSDL